MNRTELAFGATYVQSMKAWTVLNQINWALEPLMYNPRTVLNQDVMIADDSLNRLSYLV